MRQRCAYLYMSRGQDDISCSFRNDIVAFQYLIVEELILLRTEISSNPRQGKYCMDRHHTAAICIVQVHQMFKSSFWNTVPIGSASLPFQTGR